MSYFEGTDSKPLSDDVQKFLKGRQRGVKRKELQSARKKLKRNLKSKGPRTNDWMLHDVDHWDDVGYEGGERIMPRDESDRRRAVEQTAFETVDTPIDAPEARAPTAHGRQGVVISLTSGLCRVDVDGAEYRCSVRGRLGAEQTGYTNVIAVGDDVIVSLNGVDRGVVEEVLPRRSALTRPHVFRSHLQQVIVANVDQLLIVASWRDPIIWLELIDRYLIAAERNGLEAVICVNKADLIEDDEEFDDTLQPYNSLSVRFVKTSALTGEGIDELRRVLRDKTTILAGLSGTGKSSLISAVQPGLNLRTAAVSEYSGEGRHTTSQSNLMRLSMGGSVVDTPGIREFGLAGMRKHDLAAFFPEIGALSGNCRFSDCSHMNEPDCAVQEGEIRGDVPHSRLHSYNMIYATLPD